MPERQAFYKASSTQNSFISRVQSRHTQNNPAYSSYTDPGEPVDNLFLWFLFLVLRRQRLKYRPSTPHKNLLFIVKQRAKSIVETKNTHKYRKMVKLLTFFIALVAITEARARNLLRSRSILLKIKNAKPAERLHLVRMMTKNQRFVASNSMFY